ncbi:MAG: TIGR02996 domain-containing protein [Kofleriaceae bacterium]
MLELVRAEAWHEALDALLAVYQTTPARVIANAILAVSERALEDTPRIATGSVGATWQVIRALAPRANAAQRARILQTSPTSWRIGIVVPLFETLRAHGDDPRLTHAIIQFLDHQRHGLLRHYAVWRRLWDLVERAGGVHEQLSKMTVRRAGDCESDRIEFERRRQAALVRIPADPVLAPADDKLYREVHAIAKLSHVARDRRDAEGAQLLARVYANPAAREPKAIYADWLQQHGDPRGEFIALQLKDSFTRRERALIAAYDHEWRGPIAIGAGVARYRHGFPIGDRTADIDDNPWWATIEHATTVPNTDDARVPMLRRLTITEREVGQLTRLARALPVESMVLRVRLPAVFAELDRTTVLPKLRFLTARGYSLNQQQVSALLAARFVQRLEGLTFDLEPRLFSTIAPRVTGWPLRAVTILLGDERTADNGTAWRIRPDRSVDAYIGRDVRINAQLYAQLSMLAPGVVTRVSAIVHPNLDLTAVRGHLARALDFEPTVATGPAWR